MKLTNDLIFSKYIFIIYISLGVTFSAFSDQFHYHNVIPGDRAMGMAGAFCGVADDASGVYYNPAGLAFSLANEVSGSANAFYVKKLTYKKTLGSKNFVENSGGAHAPFFGGLQRLEDVNSGLAMAFGIRTVDTDLKNQNDLIINQPFIDGVNIDRFHRTVIERSSTTSIGFAVAQRDSSGLFSLGFGLHMILIDELIQEYQDVLLTAPAVNVTSLTMQNIRTQLLAKYIEPSLGFQMALSSIVTLGIALKTPFTLAETYQTDSERLTVLNDVTTRSEPLSSKVEENPLGKPPMTLRTGVAVFYSPQLLVTADVIHNTEAKEGITLFHREKVTNFATGLEYYYSPSFPIRTGLFTNFDTRPKLDENKKDQRDHVDYLGGTFFFGYVQPNSQVAGGIIYQMGEGEAQKLGDNIVIQKVEASSTTIAISATHNF